MKRHEGIFYMCSEVDEEISAFEKMIENLSSELGKTTEACVKLEDKLARYSFRPNGPETEYLKDGRVVIIKTIGDGIWVAEWIDMFWYTGKDYFEDSEVESIMEIPQ